MEQVLYRLHIKILTTTSQLVSYEVRRLLEFSCLFVAVGSLLTLFLLHSTYVINSSSPKFNCVLSALDSFEHYSGLAEFGSPLQDVIDPGGGYQSHNFRNRSTSPYNIYGVRLIQSKDSSLEPSNLSKDQKFQNIGKENTEESEKTEGRGKGGLLNSLFDNLYQQTEQLNIQGEEICDLIRNPHSDEQQYSSHCLHHSPRTVDVTIQRSESESDLRPLAASHSPSAAQDSQLLTKNISQMNITLRSAEGDLVTIRSFVVTARDLVQQQNYHYLFAFDRSVLMLSQEIYLTHPAYLFSVLEIEIHRSSRCFGPKITNRFVDLAKALDVVIMNWMIASFDGQGFLYNAKTRELLNLHYAKQWMARKGLQLHEMARRESFAKSQFQSFFNIYLDWMKRVVLWNQETLFGPVFAMVYDWFDGLVESFVESLGATTLFQFLLQRLETVTGSASGPSHLHQITSSEEGETWQKKWEVAQQYLVFRLGVIGSTSFLFFISSTLVSYILRETQERMVRFTFLLQYHVVHDLSIQSLVFTHVTESLVFVPIMMGIYFFLFEFFSDQLLAFLVLLVVWVAEVFSVLSLRSAVSIRYFPRIFFYYFALFHIYFFSYPFGFAYLALFTAFVFVFHAIMHFWNVYEVPAVESSLISATHPRIGRSLGLQTPLPRPGPTMTNSNTATRPGPGPGPEPVVRESRSPSDQSHSHSQRQSEVGIIERATNQLLSVFRPDPSNSHSRRGSGTQSQSQQRYVIQLPNVDVTRNNFSQVSRLNQNPQRRGRSVTESDISIPAPPPPPSLALPSEPISSSSSLSSPLSSSDLLLQTSTATITLAGLAEAAAANSNPTPNTNRGRSSSNVSVSSNGSLGRPAVYESLELRKMRQEQEKLRYNIHLNKPPLSSSSSSRRSSTNNNTNNNSNMVSSPPQSSTSQLSMVTALERQESHSHSQSPVAVDLPFPVMSPSSSSSSKARNVLSKDDLVGFFLEDNEEGEEAESSRSMMMMTRRSRGNSNNKSGQSYNSQSQGTERERMMMQEGEVQTQGLMHKNYSFNVFGNVLEDD